MVSVSVSGKEMGSERKSRKRRSSPSSSFEDDKDRAMKPKKRDHEKEKKTRKEDDKQRKKRKRDDKSREHSDSREGKEGKTRERHKHRKKRADKGFKELSDEDYFSKNNEFSTWLKEERGIYFSDLSSEAARDLFSSFIKAWNRQKLQSWYYDGIASAPRTAHNWKIKQDK